MQQLTEGDEEPDIVSVVRILRKLGEDRSFGEDRDDFRACDDLWASTVVFRPDVRSRSFWAAVSLKLAYISCLKFCTSFELRTLTAFAKKTKRNPNFCAQDSEHKTA
jgi:hypothetical protein